jgi:hypothetical protein
MGGAVALYAAGEQDYQAWQAARDEAARAAYALVQPALVDAGFEANAVYAEIPLYEAYGRLLGPVPHRAPESPALQGPDQPCLRLAYAPRGDPRPGVDYGSLAPGRIVIEPVAPQAGDARCAGAAGVAGS